MNLVVRLKNKNKKEGENKKNNSELALVSRKTKMESNCGNPGSKFVAKTH
jgi:hypothetical protein